METKFVTYDDAGNILLPNIKKIFLPDKGKEVMDADLSGADAQIYGADSECKALLDFFANPNGRKLYAWVASEHLQREVTSDDPEYKLYKASHHGVWYGMAVDKLALTLGCAVPFAQKLMDFYDYLYPEKELWHNRLKAEIQKRGYVTNIFGRRRWFLDRNDPTRDNKVYSFIPQSTTADVINRAWVAISKRLPNVEILAQVHDSLVVQYPIEKAEEYRPIIQKAMLIPLPYNPVVVIPSDFKVSTSSYGECEKVKLDKRDYNLSTENRYKGKSL